MPLGAGADSFRRMLGDDAIVVFMAANPEPQHSIGGLHRQCTIVDTHADGVKTTYARLKCNEG